MRYLVSILTLLWAGPATGAALALVPGNPSPVPGETFEIEVTIEDLEIGCFSFSVEFEASEVEYLGAEEGSLFADATALTYFSEDVDDSGRPQANDCLLGFRTVVSGPGPIARLRFTKLSDQLTTISIRDAVLRDVDRLPLTDVEDVSVQIGPTTTGVPGVEGSAHLRAYPNPSSTRASFILSGRAPDRTGRLQIFDLAGRLVRELDWPAGATNRAWDGRDTSGRPAANGVYHVRLDTGTRRVQTRIVRVR